MQVAVIRSHGIDALTDSQVLGIRFVVFGIIKKIIELDG